MFNSEIEFKSDEQLIENRQVNFLLFIVFYIVGFIFILLGLVDLFLLPLGFGILFVALFARINGVYASLTLQLRKIKKNKKVRRGG